MFKCSNVQIIAVFSEGQTKFKYLV